MILSDRAPGDVNEPLFFALPASSASPVSAVDGTWRCELRTSDSGEFSVSLTLHADGEKISGSADEGILIGPSTFKGEKLNLELLRENETYNFVAALKEGTLAGDWKRRDGKLSGTWTASRTASSGNEDQSTAVVPLYEYERADGQRVYSTNSDRSDKTLRRSTEPICQVWKNPMAVLILDPDAKPVPLAKN